MIYLEAPDPHPVDLRLGTPVVFLAGGITNCPDWQQEVRKELSIMDLPEFILANPRRENFPIHDPNAAREQITWEYNMLNTSEVFSMWFSNAPSDQPICMYELGRHLARFSFGCVDRVCIGVEDGYRRSQDVYVQTDLVLEDLPSDVDFERLVIANSLEQHIINISEAVRYCNE